ncbi:uncharacterized protein LOC128668814 [Microplitis demolitor]|uniref:uncharacterized protein LOC128668814 n=1 Tax=Microplitis demolitor TaxID=69319 RepID=UPI00235B6653|nr:uncharacterized protein LOC128668814 [Microplitis demolitor]
MMKLNLFFLLVATLVISSQCNPLKIKASTPQIPSLVGLALNDGSQEVGPSSGSHNSSGVNKVSANSTGEVAVIVDSALDAVFDVMDILSPKVASHVPNDGPQEVGPSSGSHNTSGVNKVSANSTGEVAIIVDSALDAVFDVMDILSPKVASHVPNDGPQEVGPSSGSQNTSGVNKVSANSTGEVAIIVDSALDAVFDVMDILSPKVASHVPNDGPQEVGPSSGSHNTSGVNKVSANSTGEVALIVDTALDAVFDVMDILSPKVVSHVPNDGPQEVGPSSGSQNTSGVNKVSANSTGEVALIVDTALDGMLYVMDVLSPKSTPQNKSD